MQSDPSLTDRDMRSEPGLGLVDGFRFGCGFSLAAAAAVLLVVLALAVLALVLSLAGVSILDNLLGSRTLAALVWTA